jgi:hypothetical protein
VKQLNGPSLFCKLLLIFSFLLFVPEVHLPTYAPYDVLSQISKLEIKDFVLNKTAASKIQNIKKVKTPHQPKYFANSFTFDLKIALQNEISSQFTFIVHSHCCNAVLARAPPQV